MYEVKAQIDPADGEQILDELIEMFEAQGKDCTCGVIGDLAVGYVEADMLSAVSTTLLRYAGQVNVQRVEDEMLVLA